MERRLALSSENADDTSRKNNFEGRRLRNTLRELEKDQSRQQKKMNSEQVEYAMQNLSVDDLQSFTVLTKKILRSSFLPPIMKPKVPGGTMAMSDPYAERLRGTKFMQNSTRRKPHKLSEKKLLRRSFSDNSLLQKASHDEQPDEGRRRKASLTYNSLFIRKQLRESHSDTSAASHGRSTIKRRAQQVGFVGELSTERSSSIMNNKKALSPRNEKTALSSTGIPPKKHHGDRRSQEKHKDEGLPSGSAEISDNESEEALCLSEVIERKLQLRELARERRNRNIKEGLEGTEDKTSSVHSKKCPDQGKTKAETTGAVTV